MTSFGKEYSQIYQFLNLNKDYKTEVDFLINLYKKYRSNNLPTSLLDLGCGSGNHIKHFPAKIKKIVGVDKSDSMITAARKVFNEKNSEFIVSDITNFKYEFKFELITMLFHVFSYLTDYRTISESFQNMNENLAKNGLIIFDFWHRPAWDFDPPISRTKTGIADGISFERTSTPTVDYLNGLVDIDIELNFSSNGKRDRVLEKHHLRAFTLFEIQCLAESHGFRILETGANLSSLPLQKDSWYGYVVLEKK